jgi:ubiquinone/menaquinone biosynthesis C-methylase UbiE
MDSTWSYLQHKKQEKDLSGTSHWPSCYTRPNSIDAWRHRRMLESIVPIVKEFPDAHWLTVGDGKFGSDAFFLETCGADVTSTSISTYTLEIAHSRGYIRKYAAENAEAMSLADSSVDFVLCKESFHHFPRPALGFYEMLRIARKGVILIEPMESKARVLAFLKSLIKRVLRDGASDQFEVSGNFIYRISIGEVSKMLTALGHPCLAWKGINDFWYPPFAAADYDTLSLGAIGTRVGIAVQDLFARLRLLNYGLAAVICFKEPPKSSLTSNLRRNRFVVVDLPTNPYRDDVEKAHKLTKPTDSPC